MQNPSFLIHNSSFLIQIHPFYSPGTAECRPTCREKKQQRCSAHCQLHKKWTFSTENHHFSGITLNSFCVFKRKVAIKCAIRSNLSLSRLYHYSPSSRRTLCRSAHCKVISRGIHESSSSCVVSVQRQLLRPRAHDSPVDCKHKRNSFIRDIVLSERYSFIRDAPGNQVVMRIRHAPGKVVARIVRGTCSPS